MKLNIYADFTYKISFEERLLLIKNSGFDGIMLGFSEGLKYTQYETADKFGLEIENVHSPFDRMNALWNICDVSEYILDRTLECIDICGKNGIRKMVIHPTDGIKPFEPTKFGFVNFSKLVDRAEKRGVDLLFENIQMPQFLDTIFNEFGESERVRFCYDIGHENCFSKGTDCLSKFSDKLSGLHIHDNDGLTDGHLIPYDGNIDYSAFLHKLAAVDYGGAMSLELYMGKSNLYDETTYETFVSEAAKAGRFLTQQYELIKKEV